MKNQGEIYQLLGPVVDVKFTGELPAVYTALTVGKLVLEVEQILGEGLVRAVAMGPTEGLKRGMAVFSTEKPITVPVGTDTLGRIFNVLGEIIDEGKPIKSNRNEKEVSIIHKSPPPFLELETKVEILEPELK
jgi:F-type H+/Na+-transporting ATPase subunit beta